MVFFILGGLKSLGSKVPPQTSETPATKGGNEVR